MSIPVYIMGILKAQETLSVMENYMKLCCFRNQIGETVTWLNIEIWVFWVNIDVLMMYVIWKQYSSLDETKVKHDVWRTIMNQQIMSEFVNVLNNSEFLKKKYEVIYFRIQINIVFHHISPRFNSEYASVKFVEV